MFPSIIRKVKNVPKPHIFPMVGTSNPEATPTFLFKCDWIETINGSEFFDGYTYSVTKPALMKEIRRKSGLSDSSTKYTAINISVVMVSMKLYKSVQSSVNKTLNTNLEPL